jgi:phosphate transport system permease protein
MSRAMPERSAGARLKARPISRLRRRLVEGLVRTLLSGSAVFSVLITFTIIAVLVDKTWEFFRLPDVTVSQFLFSTEWNVKGAKEPHFGIWPLVAGTFLVTIVAMLVALPLGMITAIYLSEYAPKQLRSVLKPTLEVLAGIPTVVYGYFALKVITPGLQLFHEGFDVFNAFSAGVAVGILCLPMVSSLAEDALHAVPRSLREGAYGLGGTRFDVSLKVVVPAALSGIISAFLLAFSRAVGETMIVALAAGSTPTLTADPRSQVQTMTGYMSQFAFGDASHFGMEYLSVYAVGATLFAITFALTFLGNKIRKSFRQAYE